MKKSYIFNLGISIGSAESIAERLIQNARSKVHTSVFFANVHMLIEADHNIEFKKIINCADIVTSDGMPLCFALKLLNNISQERVAGMDFFSMMLYKASLKKIPVFFYGSTENLLLKIVDRCKVEFPKLVISGHYSPPFRELTLKEENEFIERVRSENIGILFVALGCPKQEKFVHKLRDKIDCVVMAVGGAFPVFAKTIARAPVWMQRSGFEWLFRLIQDPIRLFSRYFLTNSLFFFLFTKEYIKKKWLYCKE